jgi:hypothetical protein
VARLGDELSAKEARRAALAAQGFHRKRPERVTLRHVRRSVRELGLLQIDFVNVLVPAQYQVLFSRLGPYRRSILDDLVYGRRELTEQFAHEASIVPTDTWPLLRRAGVGNERRARALESFMAQHRDYAAAALRQVRSRGPLSARDLPDPHPGERRAREVWNWWSIPRAALEGHFASGALAVANRLPDFSRVFDLAERVLPPGSLRAALEQEPGKDEAWRRLLERAARCHGVGTAADLADYYRMPLRRARLRLAELVENGELRTVRVEGWSEPAYFHPEARIPRRIDAASLLSPFDPVVWHRPRTARLFGFDYRVELFIPRARRKWGYYVLPFLLGDALVARVDLKADREHKRLCVLAAYCEDDVDCTRVAGALTAELSAMAAWLDLDSVEVGRRGNLAGRLRSAMG